MKVINKLNLINAQYEKLNDWALRITLNNGRYTMANLELDTFLDGVFSSLLECYHFIIGLNLNETGVCAEAIYTRTSSENIITDKSYSVADLPYVSKGRSNDKANLEKRLAPIMLLHNRKTGIYMAINSDGDKKTFRLAEEIGSDISGMNEARLHYIDKNTVGIQYGPEGSYSGVIKNIHNKQLNKDILEVRVWNR